MSSPPPPPRPASAPATSEPASPPVSPGPTSPPVSPPEPAPRLLTAPDPFPPLSVDTAPAASAPLMRSTERHLGYLPDAVSRLAASPELLGTFLRASGQFDAGTLDPLARETVVMTIAARTGCEVCLAMHGARLRALGAPPELVRGLHTGGPLRDERLETIRRFVTAMVSGDGDPGSSALAELGEAGYDARQALEIVLGIGAYTMSTYANRLVGARPDGPVAPE